MPSCDEMAEVVTVVGGVANQPRWQSGRFQRLAARPRTAEECVVLGSLSLCHSRLAQAVEEAFVVIDPCGIVGEG
jgi:hypothetical protein